jgi:NAD(P)-dependent dehydrogenase (short-subunit alcohol dehydrogenase family)
MYLDKYRLDGKTAFITGGGRGIGLAAAEALAEAGAAIIISDRDETILHAGQKELAAKGYKAEAIVLDVTRPDDVTRAADRFNANGRAVDILFANAGIAWPDTGGEEMPDKVWLEVVDIDLNGIFWSCRAFGKHMLARKSGSIVATGSMSGVISNKPQRQAHYNAAKAGVHQLVRSLAGEWAPRGVRVNAVAPGYINTAMTRGGLAIPALNDVWMENTPMKRPGEPDEIASVILFLASPASSLLTGSIVIADAGYCIW